MGRTGTFIALDILLSQAEAEGQVDVYNTVHRLRTERQRMVQTLVGVQGARRGRELGGSSTVQRLQIECQPTVQSLVYVSH